MVHETAKSTPLTCLRSSLTSVLLPEPDGAEMMNKMPATYSRSLSISYLRFCSLFSVLLHVLNLLAGLFNLRFHGQAQLRNARSLPAYAGGF